MSPGRVPPPRALPLGAPAPVAPPSSGRFGVLGPGPPRLRWAAAGLARRPCLRLGLRSRPGPLGLRPAGPGSGPLRRGRPALGALAVVVAFRRCPRLRGSRRPIGGPPAPVGAAPGLPRRAPLRRGRVRPVAALARPRLGPLLGGSGRPALVACRPLAGALRSCRRAAAPPPSSRRVPLPGALSGGPASALGRRASSLRGRLGAAVAALCPAAAPSVGVFAPAGVWLLVAAAGGPATSGSPRQGSSRAAQAPPLTGNALEVAQGR